MSPNQALSFVTSRQVVPPRALWFSLVTLALPVVANWLRPEWMVDEGALIAWVPAVRPAFLLAYYRGWHGASLVLAGAMATLAATQAEVLLLDASVPDWGFVFAVVSILVAVTLGAGWIAELLHRERELAEGRTSSPSRTRSAP